MRLTGMARHRAPVVLAMLALAAAAWARGSAVDPGSAAVEIYPTADRLPANLLRVYLVFDRPMSAGESRARLLLQDEAGRRVEGAFLQLEEELWDASGRRLTVLFDPGRIKRGLRANLESGAPLVEGRRYRLVIDGAWRDAGGRPIGAGASKAFDVIAPDRTPPDVGQWAIEAPPSGTRAPVALRFPEILDRALLSSAITVVDPAGVPVRGEIDVEPGERVWRFSPERAWQSGTYSLRVSSELEDVAGNSLLRVFDAEMREGAADDEGPAFFTRPFEIARSGGPPAP